MAASDCCFVEDTCVVVKDTAVINQLGHVSRQKEIGPNAEALKQVWGYRGHINEKKEGWMEGCTHSTDIYNLKSI
jgi:N-dimethylarginine dimethylaminohydrolase